MQAEIVFRGLLLAAVAFSLMLPSTGGQKFLVIVLSDSETDEYVYGDNITLFCITLGGTPPFTYGDWMPPEDSTSVSSGEITNNGSTLMFTALESDSGSFTCSAIDSEGETDSGSEEIEVIPAILNEPVDVNLVYRDNLTAVFTCNAFGGDGAMLGFQWSVVNSDSSLTALDPNLDTVFQREYINEEDNSTTSEIIINVTLADRGNKYACQVRYTRDAATFGMPETASILSIVPAILKDPQDILVGVGLEKNASFNCIVFGGPFDRSLQFVFDWSGPDGVDVNNTETSEPFNDMVISTLNLLNVTEEHEGNYSCSVAYSDMPEIVATSEIATLGAITDPPVITEPPADVVEDAGNTTNLTCSAVGNGTLSIEWILPSGDILYPDQKITFGAATINLQCWFDPYPWQIMCVLMIEYIMAEVGGSYTCIAENEVGITEVTAVLSVNLYISGDMVRLNTTNGTTENITCMIEGFPISYIWQKMNGTVSDDGSDVVSGSSSGSGSGSGHGSNSASGDSNTNSEDELMVTYMNVSTGRILEFNPVIFRDEGVYHCVAQSGVGDELISDAVTVTISPEDGVSVVPVGVVYDEGDNVTLTCSSLGGPGNTLQWFRDDENITSVIEASDNNLILTDITVAGDGGMYTCVASNAAGMGEASVSLNISPQFIVQPVGDEITDGTDVSFTCVASAFPEPEYMWVKVDGELPVSAIGVNSSTLILSPAVFGDQGLYYCKATSSGISITSDQVTLTISPEGGVLIEPDNETFDDLGTVVLTCMTEDGPGNVYQWSFNGEELENENSSHLTLVNVTAADGGAYTCNVTNAAGYDTYTTYVFISPMITLDPVSRNVSNGTEDVTFSCDATGFPQPEFEWFSDEGLPLPDSASGGNTATLTIDIVLFGDEGRYYCNATSNDLTVESERTTLSVAPLVIDISSDGTIAFIGEDFLFMCNVLGGPNNEFQWTLNSVILPDETMSTLQLTNVAVNDAGVYSCIVSNSAGENSSETELFIAPNIITSPQDMTANATENVTFTCVADGAPVPNITWEYAGIDDNDTPSTSDDSGNEFSMDTVVSLTTVNSTLTLEASFFNYGEYRCVATSDPLMLNVSATAVLYVAPSVSVTPSEINSDRDVSHDVTCTVLGGPDNEITWQKLDSDEILSNTSVLVINVTDALVGGVYQCTAENLAGSDAATTTVYVIPVFSQSPEDINITITEDLVLECSADGFPLPSIEWTHIGTVVQPDTVRITITEEMSMDVTLTSRLSVSDTSLTDSGEYRCIAMSTAAFPDVNSSIALVLIQDTPEPPQNLTALNITSRSITLQWMEPHHNNAPVTGYIVTYTEPDFLGVVMTVLRSGETVVVTGLHPGVEYVFTVVAENNIGQSVPSDAERATTLEEVPNDSPQNVMATALSSTEIEVSWEEVPAISRNGIIIMYEVQYEPLETFDEQISIETVNITDISILSTDLTGLEEYVEYTISVRAYTIVGPGPYSSGVVETTDEAAPDMPPVNITATAVSSTEIEVVWEEVPAISHNGEVTMYEVIYDPIQTFDVLAVNTVNITNTSMLFTVLTGLEEYVEYNISVRAYTSTGPGPYSDPVTVRTDTDNPDAAPQEVMVMVISSTEIAVSWEEVPAISQNGLITMYEIQYEPLETFDDQLAIETVITSGPVLMLNLIGLEEYVEYNISVRAYTSTGLGPYSDPVFFRILEDDSPSIVHPPARIEAVYEDAVELTCTAEGFPRPDIMWLVEPYGGGLPVNIATNFTITAQEVNIAHTTSILTLPSVNPQDTANYTCNATNRLGEDTARAVVQVLAGAEIIPEDSTSVRVNESDPVELLCRVRGSPVPYFMWYIGEEEAQPNMVTSSAPSGEPPDYIYINSTLSITSVTPDDTANYTCTASNDIYGTQVNDSQQYSVIVNFIPVVSEAPSDTNVTTNEDLRLVCCIRGSPTPLIDWYHNDSLVTLNERTTIEPLFQEDMNSTACSAITVSNTGFPDSGQYTCTGVNAVGNISSLPALVLIQAHPEKPIITGAVNVTSDSLILLWSEPHHNNAPLLGFHVSIIPIFTTVTVEDEYVLVTGLEPGETYHFQVIAFNSIGDSVPSDPFIVTTLETVPEAPPENVTAVVISSTAIMVRWSEVASLAQNGEITHYEVQFFPLVEFDGGIYNGSVPTANMSIVLADLQEYVTYNISVRAYNGAGAGPFSNGIPITTLQDVPSASPEDVEAVGKSSSELFVSWSEVPDVDQNGIISRYEVELKPTQSQSSRDISVIPTDSRNMTVGRLEIFTQYAIRVRALTNIGSGPYSDEILAATLEDVPIAAPAILSVIGVTSTVIELEWEEVPVIYRNGIITAYEVEYRQFTFEQTVQSVTVNASNLTTRLTGLHEYVEYFIKIRAYTSIGPGPYSTLINTTTLQDVPSMSPANVTANVTSSTSMTVTWESVPDIHQNGIITQYEVQYSTESAFGGTATVITPASNMTINLAGLEEYTEYSIRVSAHTAVGAGSFSQPTIATTHEDVPAAQPARVGAFAISESSIQIAWDEVPAIHRNGIITLYEVQYWQSGDESDTTTVPVDPDEFVLDVDGLGDFLTYLIRVRASTAVGAGPYSSPAVEVAPEQDVPSAPPFNVSTQTISSSEILVMWNEVPAIERNGIITKYEVEYRQTTFSSDSVQNVEVTASTRQTTLDGLLEYTEYFIRVRAYTIIGDGPYSNESVATTLQDTPDASPTNINVSSLSSTSLHVSWGLVPAVDQNGDITQYDVEYTQSTFPQRPTSVTESLAAGNVSWTLSGLEEYVVYTVRVRAHTVIGAGPYSSPMTSRTLEDVPAGYPDSLSARPLSPTEVTLHWQSIPAIDHNGILLYYEVLFNQSTFTSLPLAGVSVNDTQQSASVGPLQPFTPYSMTVRANTSAGYGPPNPDPVITMTDPTGLTLTIRNKDLVVKEGNDLNIVCEMSSETVGLEWVLPEAVSNNADTVVEYSEPLRHVLTIRNANIKHSGVYMCGVLGDVNGTISRDSATVRVREKCFEDFSGGLLWEIAFDEDTIAKPCRDIDNSFSMVVKVYRRCQSMRRWTSVDFSGCTLSSSDQQVLIIISLRVPTTSITSIDFLDLEQQLIQGAHMDSGVEPRVSALEQLPQTLGEQSLLLLKVFYTTAEQAQTGSWDTVLCSEDDLTVGSTTVSIERREVAAVMRSDFCECRQVLQTPVGDGSGATDDGNTLLEPEEPKLGCPVDNLDIQELCNGTLASPCNCTGSSLECECVSPYVGDGSLCVLDSDGDGYPNLALRTCSETDSFIYCSADTCPFARNPDQTNVSPCKGDETDCPEDIDSVWNILWPFTPPDVTVSVSCGVDFVGNATRRCRPDLNWEPPDVTNCQSRIFVDIMERVDEALASADTEVVLEVVEELVQATETEDVPQLPQDLNTTNDIITNTLDLLFSDLEMNIQQNDTNATSVQATVVIFEALDNILSESNQASFDSLQEVGGAGSQAVLMNAESFSLYAAQVLALEQDMEPGQTANISVTGENLALRVQSIAVDEDTEYSFPSQQEIMQLTLPNSALADISLSSAIIPESATSEDSNSVVVASVLFTTLQSFLPPSATDTVAGEPASLIISTQIAVGGQVMRTNLESPVTINFQFAAVPADDILEERVIQCAFWDFGNSTTDLSDSGWSADGVSTAMSTTVGNVSTVECASLHLTSFAVLVDVRGVEINTKALSIVSYIGLSFSSVCLIFTIIFFLSLRKELFTAVYNFVHLNLSIALLAGYIVFAVGVELAASNTIGCKAVTALVQYFFLAAFSWMLCEGVMLYLMLVVVFSTIKRKWWFFLLLGWGIPLPFIAIGLGAFHDDYGVKDITGKFKYCWLSSGEGKYAIWTFIAPMLAIILINVTFLVLVLRSIYKTKSNKQRKTSTKGEKAGKNKKDIKTVKSILKAAVILLPLLGMTWVFGLFAVNENTAVFAWLFTICNSLQGFLIFLFHVLRSKLVSGKLKKRYSLYSSTVSNKLGTLSSTLRRSTAKSSSATSRRSLSSIRKFRTSSLSSSLTESESEWRSESIVIRNPKLPVIFEGKEVELKFLELNEESEYEESEFGPDDNDDDALESQAIVKVDIAAIEVK